MKGMRIFLESHTSLPKQKDSYMGLINQVNRILLGYKTPGIMGAGFVVPNQPQFDAVTRFVQERIRGIEIPNALGVSLLKAPRATLEDIDALPILGNNPNLVIMLPWGEMNRLHTALNLGTAASKYPRPEEPGNELAFLIGDK